MDFYGNIVTNGFCESLICITVYHHMCFPVGVRCSTHHKQNTLGMHS